MNAKHTDAQGAPFAYAIYGIGAGKHYVREIKQIDQFDTDGDWKTDDDGLGEYWAGNTPLFRATEDEAQTSGVALRAQLVVATQVEDGMVTVAVNLKHGDHTTVLYIQNHEANGGSMGVVDLAPNVAAQLAGSAAPGTAVPGGLIVQFLRCAYPVAPEINPRSYNWCEAWLDEARKAALAAAPLPQVQSEALGEYLTCCDHSDCSKCAGRGGIYRVAKPTGGV